MDLSNKFPLDRMAESSESLRNELRMSFNPWHMYQYEEWVIAIYSWERGEFEMLSELIHSVGVPTVYRRVVSDIVSGSKKSNQRGKSNQKHPPSVRLRMAFIVEKFRVHKRLSDEMVNNYGLLNDDKFKTTLKELKSFYSIDIRDEIARQLAVSIPAIKKWERELSIFKKRWPNFN